MRILITTMVAELGILLGKVLQERGLGDVEVRTAPVTSFELRFRAGRPDARILAVLGALAPLSPKPCSVSDLPREFDLEIRLGDPHPLSRWKLRIHADSTAIAEELRRRLVGLGYNHEGTLLAYQPTCALKRGGATPLACHVVLWVATSLGLEIEEEHAWGDHDNDLWLYVRDPAHAGMSAGECFEVALATDDPPVADKLAAELRRRGFPRITTVPLERGDGSTSHRFIVEAGPLSHPDTEGDLQRLVKHVGHFLRRSVSVDLTRFPVEMSPSSRDPLQVRVVLPVSASRRGLLRPYGGPHADRFKVTIRTDDPARAEPLQRRLTELGLAAVHVAPLDDATLGFRLMCGSATRSIRPRVRKLLEQAMLEIDATGFSLHETTTDDEEVQQDLTIDFPVSGVSDGSLHAAILHRSRDYDFRLYTSCPAAELEPLLDKLHETTFATFDLESQDVEEGVIRYGGAPRAVVEHIRRAIREVTGIDLELRKAWHDDDTDIAAFLPAPGPTDARPPAPTDVSHVQILSSTPESSPSAALHPALRVEGDQIWITDVVLKVRSGPRSPLAPHPSSFAHFCLDSLTCELLRSIALSVLLGEPLLIEGETSASKTMSILALACWLNQPVVRVNLHGQVDTAEIVGRHLPDGRSWRFQPGPLLRAMMEGMWLILDEVNLGEPSVLERCNSVLEDPPSLLVTEHDYSIVGPGGSPAHPDFRCFGTMNPAEYQGRAVLSPAYRNRWRGHFMAAVPGEVEHLALLNLLVHGRQPACSVGGVTYKSWTVPAPLPALAAVPHIDAFLGALARFHASLECAVSGRVSGARLGAQRREPYVFTRRELLSVMRFIGYHLPSCGDDVERVERLALSRYYVTRIADAADRAVVLRLLDAAGLGSQVWRIGPPNGAADSRTDETISPDDRFDVVLVRCARRHKLEAIGALRRLTDRRLGECKTLLETPGNVLLASASGPEARSLQAALEAAGAKALLRRTEREEPGAEDAPDAEEAPVVEDDYDVPPF